MTGNILLFSYVSTDQYFYFYFNKTLNEMQKHLTITAIL